MAPNDQKTPEALKRSFDKQAGKVEFSTPHVDSINSYLLNEETVQQAWEEAKIRKTEPVV